MQILFENLVDVDVCTVYILNKVWRVESFRMIILLVSRMLVTGYITR